ncbi:hypothetical protein [Lysobacter silvisoli]|uniref:Uncharacterized protein n=1 Tax=Lysobacter silvisoli TaxID=2293254 RepID=A0A371K605_9GAMM|nr:hypothetical protein [Lysobacter silvisoli]RDZ29277.1 hypothetical protein DX914_09390 [Lysobacter silvisoli]
MHTPDRHLLLKVDNLGERVRTLMDALLRVDLGARIKPDTARGAIDIEGWFRDEDVVAAVLGVGGRLSGVEVRPPTSKRLALAAHN